MSGFQKGDKVWLRGTLTAGQDFSRHVFHFGDGKEFEIMGLLPERRLQLMAEGYGKPYAYGNGCLFVTYEQIAEPAAEWKPEVGKECEWFHIGRPIDETFTVTPMVHDDKEGLWVCRKKGTAEYHGVPTCELRPLPPEPTVKPCPHCGGPAELIPLGDGLMTYGCKDRCQRRYSIIQGVALKHWNQRMEVPSC